MSQPSPLKSELPPTAQKAQADTGTIKEGVGAFGAVVTFLFVGIDAVTSAIPTFEKPVPHLMSLSLALIFLGGLSLYLGGREYPRYGKMATNILIIVGMAGLAVVCVLLGF